MWREFCFFAYQISPLQFISDEYVHSRNFSLKLVFAISIIQRAPVALESDSLVTEEAHAIVVLIREAPKRVGCRLPRSAIPRISLKLKFGVWTCHNVSQGQENFSSLFLDDRSMSESDSHHGTAVRERSHMDLKEIRPFFREFLVLEVCRDQGSRECDCYVLDARVTSMFSNQLHRIRTHAPDSSEPSRSPSPNFPQSTSLPAHPFSSQAQSQTSLSTAPPA